MLEVNNVTFHYSTQEESPPALRNVNLRISAGETVAIIGHNGSGKTTLSKLLAAILHPTSGSILVDGLPTNSKGEDLWTIRQRVGIVFQNPDDQLVANTVIDDIAFGPENLTLPRHEIVERVEEAMAILGLEDYAQLPISELSVGQKQRVAIAGVLAMRPRYLVLDEPTTMISGQTARHLMETLHRLAHERGISIIHITHFMREVTSFQRVIVMHEGSVLMDDTPVAVFAHADKLRPIGLDVPLVTQLGRRLRAQGWTSLPEVVLSIEQLKAGLSDLFSGEMQTTSAKVAQEAGCEPPHDNNPSQDSAIQLKDVSHTYLRHTPFETVALRGLTLSITAGQTVALIGPAQAGKSTLVDVLAGLIKPAPGSFLFEGDDVAAQTFDIERIRTAVGVVFQSPETQIFEETVGKDVSFGPRRKNVALAESRRLVQESLEAVGLPYEDFRSRYTYALSGGQKRRVAIAGVLALQPRIIIFDEPSAGLDPHGRHNLLHLIATLKQRHNLTTIYVSCSLEDVIDLADIIHILDQGRMTFSGSPREILARADDLAALDIALPEMAQIALSLRSIMPAIRTDVLNLNELEETVLACAVKLFGQDKELNLQ